MIWAIALELSCGDDCAAVETIEPATRTAVDTRKAKCLNRISSSRQNRRSLGAARTADNAQALFQVIADPQCVCHDRQCGIHRGARREEAPIHNVEVVHIMRLAVNVQRGSPGIGAKANGAILVSDSRMRSPRNRFRANNPWWQSCP